MVVLIACEASGSASTTSSGVKNRVLNPLRTTKRTLASVSPWLGTNASGRRLKSGRGAAGAGGAPAAGAVAGAAVWEFAARLGAGDGASLAWESDAIRSGVSTTDMLGYAPARCGAWRAVLAGGANAVALAVSRLAWTLRARPRLPRRPAQPAMRHISQGRIPACLLCSLPT